MKKKLFVLGTVLGAVGLAVLLPSLYGAYLGSGTRLLTSSTFWGHLARYAPIGLIAAAVLLLTGILMAWICYVPSAKRLRRKAERAEAKAAKAEAAKQACLEPASPSAAQPEKSSSSPVESTVPQASPAPAPPPAVETGDSGGACPACGTVNPPGSAFCTECGQRL